MKVFIGIPVYNRIDKLILLAKSIQNINKDMQYTLNIFDDCSTDFDEVYLNGIFSSANILRNKNNIGADRNTYNIWKAFLESDEDLLFVCDSDLILHQDILMIIKNNFVKTEGVLSLLNASSHLAQEVVNKDLIVKNTVGSAGTVFSREIVQDLLNNVDSKYITMWDWYFCMYLNEKEKRIFVTKNSYVLHAGIDGENSNVMLFDFSQNFIPSNEFEKEMEANLNKIFTQKYHSLSDWQKSKVLIRKIIRERIRTIIGKLFGQKTLLDLLVWRKNFK